MDKKKAKERIEKLKEEINHHRYLYHVLDRQEISDSALDSLKHELVELERKWPQLLTPDSPSQRVGGKALAAFKKVSHQKPMLSLEDVFSEDDFQAWVKRIQKLVPSKKLAFFGELKIDGFAVSLTFKNGIFFRGATRGDGKTGEDVTQNLKTIEAIPLRLLIPKKTELGRLGLSPKRAAGSISRGIVEVRGEVFMSKRMFEKINREQKKKKLPSYANPRNTAAGSIRQLDPKIAGRRKLDFLAYDLQTNLGQKTHSQEHKLLKLLGFKTDALAKELGNAKKVFSFWLGIKKRREKLAWGIDGLVVSVNENNIYERLGVVGKAPRGAVAFKFPGEEAATVVEDIILQVGRTGVLTPIAILKPVNIGGVVVRRATLHNMDEIERLGVKIGDTIVIERAGDVIPNVIKVLPKLRPRKARALRMPSRCPLCNSPVVKEGVYYRCRNKNCPALRRRHLSHFTSKYAFNIVGLGAKILGRLYEEGILHDGADIFDLKTEDIAPLKGFGAKSAHNLLAAIEAAKKITLARLIFSLGILHVGEETAYDLAQQFGSLAKIKASSLEGLKSQPNIGEVVALYEVVITPPSLRTS